ncbi:hypothetical protein L2E82_01309 [Cichorium intybus]|uniref:Uncharacterized protein n=1 Tax=Cichorium intybus TaxID=13427 RepID=A0ACB9H006_CICIN|nr:hypothetical protein L2E82_01309 [Cichorium intybus]
MTMSLVSDIVKSNLSYCNVFIEDLYIKLGHMFGFEKSNAWRNLVYQNAAGVTKHTGDEPFSVFSKAARDFGDLYMCLIEEEMDMYITTLLLSSQSLDAMERYRSETRHKGL